MNFKEKVPNFSEKLDKGSLVPYVTTMKNAKPEVTEAFINAWEVGTVTLTRHHYKFDINIMVVIMGLKERAIFFY